MASEGKPAGLWQQSSSPDTRKAVAGATKAQSDEGSPGSGNFIEQTMQTMQTMHKHLSREMLARISKLEESQAEIAVRQSNEEQTAREREATFVKRSEWESFKVEIEDFKSENRSLHGNRASKLDKGFREIHEKLDGLTPVAPRDKSNHPTSAHGAAAATANENIPRTPEKRNGGDFVSFPASTPNTAHDIENNIDKRHNGTSIGSPLAFAADVTSENFIATATKPKGRASYAGLHRSGLMDSLLHSPETSARNFTGFNLTPSGAAERHPSLHQGYMAKFHIKNHLCRWNATGFCRESRCSFSHDPADYAAAYLAALNRFPTNDRVEDVEPPCVRWFALGWCNHGGGNDHYSHESANLFTLVERFFELHRTELTLQQYLELLRRPEPGKESQGFNIRGRAQEDPGADGLKREQSAHDEEGSKRHRSQ